LYHLQIDLCGFLLHQLRHLWISRTRLGQGYFLVGHQHWFFTMTMSDLKAQLSVVWMLKNLLSTDTICLQYQMTLVWIKSIPWNGLPWDVVGDLREPNLQHFKKTSKWLLLTFPGISIVSWHSFVTLLFVSVTTCRKKIAYWSDHKV
jgi:hypothetical protein